MHTPTHHSLSLDLVVDSCFHSSSDQFVFFQGQNRCGRQDSAWCSSLDWTYSSWTFNLELHYYHYRLCRPSFVLRYQPGWLPVVLQASFTRVSRLYVETRTIRYCNLCWLAYGIDTFGVLNDLIPSLGAEAREFDFNVDASFTLMSLSPSLAQVNVMMNSTMLINAGYACPITHLNTFRFG